MKGAVIGPTLWVDASSNPARAQARLAEVLRILEVAGIRPFTTARLRQLLVESPELQEVMTDYRSDEYVRQGVVGDQFLRALFGLLTEAWLAPVSCLWDRVRDVQDGTDETSVRDDIHEEFIAALATAEIESGGAVSPVVYSRPDGAQIYGRATDVICAAAEENDEVHFTYAAASTSDGWLAAQLGRLPSARANIEAALVGRPVPAPWRVHGAFERSLMELPDTRPGRLREVYRACATAIERDPQQLGAADDEPLTSRHARQDGAEARRLRIAQNTPAAPRLHYWLRADYVEIGVAVQHDRFDLPE